MNKIEKFNKNERLLLRIHLSILGFGLLLLMISYVAVNSIDTIAKTFLGIVYSLFYIVIIIFGISIIRLIKYLIAFRDIEQSPSIKNTIIIILTSPISIGIYFILTLAMSLSLASCSY